MSPPPRSRRGHDHEGPPADGDRHDTAVQATSGVNAVLGLWLMITPSMFDYQGRAALAISQGVVGLLLLGSAGFRLAKPRSASWLSWLNVGLGLWLILAPFLLVNSGTDDAAYWNSGITGAIVAALGLWSALSTRREHAQRRR